MSATGDAARAMGVRGADASVQVLRSERRARNELIGLLALYLVTLAVSLAKGQDVFVFAYIMTVVVVVGGPRRHGRSWASIGVKGGFFEDLRRVWPLSALVAVVFQFVPPTVAIAFAAGYGRDLLAQIRAASRSTWDRQPVCPRSPRCSRLPSCSPSSRRSSSGRSFRSA